MAPAIVLLTVMSILAPPAITAGTDEVSIEVQHLSSPALGEAEARVEETEDDSDERSFFVLVREATIPPASSTLARFVPHTVRTTCRPRVGPLCRAPPRI